MIFSAARGATAAVSAVLPVGVLPVRVLAAVFLAAAVLAMGMADPAQGAGETPQANPPVTPQVTAAHASQTAQSDALPFDIPPQPLSQALNAFIRATGWQVGYPATLVEGVNSPGVQGTLAPEEALTRLLEGSDLAFRATGASMGTLERRAAAQAEAVPHGPPPLDTIHVYGARNVTTLEDTSASVGIVTAEDIDYGQMQYLPEALRRMANVEKGATNNTGIVIRGMNFEGFSPAGAPMGSIYVDGVLQSRYNSRFGARGLWDAEQVEVYRGPQSTLSGRAATAGAVYVKTKDPTFEEEVVLSGTVGNKNLAGGAFVVNTPVSEAAGLALRIAGSYEQNETEIDYPNYAGFDNLDEFRTELSGNLRAKLLFGPEELPDTDALLTYSYSKDRPNERLVGPDIGDRGDFYQFSTFAEFREIDVHNFGLEVKHDITPALTLTSQTGVSHGITDRESVDNGTAGVVNAFYGTYYDTLLTQELRLNYDEGRWNGVAGVFGSYEDQDSEFFARLTEWNIEQEQFYKRKTTNLAAFGEATYEFAPSWKFTLGGRVDYLEEHTDETDILTFIGVSSTTTDNSATIREVNVVPKVGITKEFGEDHVAGFTFSQGFRTGGFYVDPDTGDPETYDPEFADNYELFYKGKFLDKRLRTNLNVFYTRYSDQQVETYPDPSTPTGTIVTNAASSYALGFEFEPSFDVDENLSLFASVGYLHTEFEDFDHSIYGDMSGESFPEAPEWSIAAGGLYKFDSGFYIGADAKFLSDHNSRFSTNPPLDHIDSRFLMNLQAGFRQDNWEVNLFAENLLDERYYTVTELDGTPAFAQIGPSRLFGVNFKAKF